MTQQQTAEQPSPPKSTPSSPTESEPRRRPPPGFGSRHALRDPSDVSEPYTFKRQLVWDRLCLGWTVALSGERGTGKTQIAHEIASEWQEHRRRAVPDGPIVRYHTVAAMFRLLRDSMREGTETKVFRELCESGLLILDELQVRGETPYEDRTLTELIDVRYANERPTLLITNLVGDKMLETLGASIASRMEECGIVVACDWASFRKSGT